MNNARLSPAALRAYLVLVLGAVLAALPARADLSLDTGFDTDGIAQVDFAAAGDAATDLAVAADGDLVLVGSSSQTTGADTIQYVALTRLDGATGAPDAGFGTAGKFTFLPGVTATDGGGGVPRAVVIQPGDQKILVTGTWRPDDAGATQVFVARLLATGALDPAFGTSGVVLLTPAGVTDPTGNAIALRSDGGIVIAGAGTASGESAGYVTALDSDGGPLAGFATTVVPNPLGTDGDSFAFNALAILAGDAVLAGGGGGDLTVARFTSAGALDASFGTGGLVSFNYFTFDTASGPSDSADVISDLLVLGDDRILVAGQAVAGGTRALLARLTAAGALDPTFGSGGYAPLADTSSNGPATGLGVRPSGDIVLSGSGFKPVQVSPNGLAQTPLPGTFAFGVNALRVLAGGDVAVGGVRAVAGANTAFGAARLVVSDLADGIDLVPDPFSFTTQTGLETGITATSNPVTIQGIAGPAPISVTGGDLYSIGCGTYTAAAGTVTNGQTVCVRTTTPTEGESDNRAFLTVGNVFGQFAVITGDAKPDTFDFVDQTGVAVNSQVVSAPVTLAGLTISTSVSVSGGEFSVGCTGTWTVSTATANPGAQVCVRHTAAATPGATTTTTLTVGKGATVQATFTSTTAGDVTPNAFTFVDQTGVAKSTVITSAAVTLSGFTDNTSITVTGGTYSIGCGSTFTSAAGTVAPGATVCVRHTSSAAGGTATNTVLTVGGVSDTFTSTTAGTPDTTPDAFTFPAQAGVGLATQITSGVITLAGFDTAAPIAVSGGSYSKNCSSTGFTTTSSTLAPGVSVCVRHTSALAGSTPVTTVLTVGGVSGTFTSTTRSGDAVPAPFTFPSRTGVDLATEITSAAVTITGIDIASPVTVQDGTYSIGCTASFTAAQGTISNGQTVCVRHESSFNSNADVVTTLNIGTESATFTSTTRTGDQFPDPFPIASQDHVARNTRVVSAPVTITGIDSPAGIQLSGPDSGFPFFSPLYGFSRGCTGTDVDPNTDDQLIDPGETICISVLSADADDTSVVVTVTVGGTGVDNRRVETFTVTTGETVPDAFTFEDQVGVPTVTTVNAAPITITGITAPAAVTISANGQYQINCTGSFTSDPGVVADGDTICVRHISSGALSSQVNTTLTVGGVSDTFTSTTTDQSTPLPGSSAIDPVSLLLLAPLLGWRRRRGQ